MDKRVTLYAANTSSRWQNVVVGSASATTSTAINASQILINVGGPSSTAFVYLAFGTNPTASTSGFVVPSNSSMLFNFTPGDKVSVLASAGSGVISIVPLV